MTVGELIAALRRCDPGAVVYWAGDPGDFPRVESVEGWGSRVHLLENPSPYEHSSYDEERIVLDDGTVLVGDRAHRYREAIEATEAAFRRQAREDTR